MMRGSLDEVLEYIYRHSKVVGALVCGALIFSLLVIFRSAPPKAPPKKIAALVSVESIAPETTRVGIVGYGTVEAFRELEVRSQVNGHIVKLNEQMQVGGRIPAGATLAQIDPRDYEIAVEAQEAALARAEFELKLEQGNRIVAEKEWELLEKDIEVSKLGRTLALREPHLKEKQAAYSAARAQLKKARLDLERSTMKTPFDAVVLEESLEVGKYINSQMNVAKIAATDRFQVRVRISRKELQWLEGKKSPVTVVQTLGNGNEIVHEAELAQILGDVDRTGRMAQLLVTIPDPLGLEVEKEALLIGSYVRVEIEGVEVEDVYRIPRSAFREGGKVWVFGDASTLVMKDAQIVFSRGAEVFVRGELDDELQVITTPLQGALSGMALEIVPDSGLEDESSAESKEEIKS